VPAGTAASNGARLFAHRLLRRPASGKPRSTLGSCARGSTNSNGTGTAVLADVRSRCGTSAHFSSVTAAASSDWRLSWSAPEQHVRNWQRPENLFLTLQEVSHAAVDPVRSWTLSRLLRPRMRVLEYGCGAAPMYRTLRRFLAHVPIFWVLADIPGFPLHYARHVYGTDASAAFVCITPDRFSDPLRDVDGSFDLIIVAEVFEHLDAPRRLAEYLLDRLASGGLLHFDYIESGATGLDTPAGLAQQQDTCDSSPRACTCSRAPLASRGTSAARWSAGRGPRGARETGPVIAPGRDHRRRRLRPQCRDRRRREGRGTPGVGGAGTAAARGTQRADRRSGQEPSRSRMDASLHGQPLSSRSKWKVRALTLPYTSLSRSTPGPMFIVGCCREMISHRQGTREHT
jgi:SAM-dependent methyltransferase